MKLTEYFDYLSQWIKQRVEKAGMKGVVVGMSGGVDSSVVAALAKKAFPEKGALGIMMPIDNIASDLEDSKDVAKIIGIENIMIDLSKTFEASKEALGVSNKLAIANIKPRLRMMALYAYAQENNYLVLGTDNLAEWKLGYFTKYGDGGVDLLPIVHLQKSEVKQLAKEIGLPENIFKKDPSAGLWENQTDEEELGFKYDDFEKYWKKEELDQSIKSKIEKQIKTTEHKRQDLPVPNKFD